MESKDHFEGHFDYQGQNMFFQHPFDHKQIYNN